MDTCPAGRSGVTQRTSAACARGAAGSLAVLLLWLYYAGQVFLFGAELAAIIMANPLLADLYVKRQVRWQGHGLRNEVFATRPHFV